jgi:hypothetical protein
MISVKGHTVLAIPNLWVPPEKIKMKKLPRPLYQIHSAFLQLWDPYFELETSIPLVLPCDRQHHPTA